MQLEGKVLHISNEETFGSGFKKIGLIIKTNEQYPQEIAVEAHNDKILLVDSLNVGDEIKAHINVRGKMWQKDSSSPKRWFNSLVLWKVEQMEGNQVDNNNDGLPY